MSSFFVDGPPILAADSTECRISGRWSDTGQAVEIMAVLAAFFIVVSLAISGAMNVLNSRSAWATH